MKIIESIFIDKVDVNFVFDRLDIHSVDYIFIDGLSKELLTCDNLFRQKKNSAILIIFSCGHKQGIYIPPCYINTFHFNMCDSIERCFLQVRNVFKLRRESVKAVGRCLCRDCIFDKRISPQQKKVAESLILGMDCKMIAKTMNISYKTVQTYKLRLMNKCQVKSMHELHNLLLHMSKKNCF